MDRMELKSYLNFLSLFFCIVSQKVSELIQFIRNKTNNVQGNIVANIHINNWIVVANERLLVSF